MKNLFFSLLCFCHILLLQLCLFYTCGHYALILRFTQLSFYCIVGIYGKGSRQHVQQLLDRWRYMFHSHEGRVSYHDKINSWGHGPHYELCPIPQIEVSLAWTLKDIYPSRRTRIQWVDHQKVSCLVIYQLLSMLWSKSILRGMSLIMIYIVMFLLICIT